MSTWTALLLATPLFGVSLSPPTPGSLAGSPPTLGVPPLAVGSSEVPDPTEAAEGSAEPAEVETGPSFAQQMRRRQKMARIHKAFGIATWSAMTVTMALGWIQYHNLYGGGRDDNPCVTGDAIFGQGQCTGTPWPHAASATVTTALYATTFSLSLFMPDPGGLDEGSGEFARKLRTHKILRWVHLGGMVAQALLGIVVANSERFGLDRANDYRALQGLATVHLVSGMVTYGALTWAGALMVF